ncbi:VOC family protein [Chamaesiphon minutus]|uniref:Lactoylglutathione lyase family protein n=1 Tax=Chamaesiphon minutus (strain ATCC 27169 / PCC 6605) TaxID=1173020 RepID=K9UHS2_CHAP6|nr:VOC family protein [Chamaesiphon minutus]AFY94340.1 lactoylglutathione lyase family protein [Chamaesiphon minutus PCC 6605]
MTNLMQQHGAFSWCELMTTNTTTAKEFYSQLFGWEIVDRPVSGMMYSVLNVGELGVGGLMEMPPDMAGIPPHWGVYVTVDDVDASAKLVEDLGGQIKYPPSDIPDVGRFAVIQDPQGAVLSIISYPSNS